MEMPLCAISQLATRARLSLQIRHTAWFHDSSMLIRLLDKLLSMIAVTAIGTIFIFDDLFDSDDIYLF
jgi:hypothetical protein